MTPTVFATADELIAHLRMLATIPSAESDEFTELDHGLQTAAWCERRAPGDAELALAEGTFYETLVWNGAPPEDFVWNGRSKTLAAIGSRSSVHILERAAERFRVASASAITHDAAEVQGYGDDPRVHDRISARLARFTMLAVPAVIEAAPRWTVPTLLLYAGQDAAVRPAGSAAFARAAPAGRVVAQAFPQHFHELFNERDRACVFRALGDWLTARWAPVDQARQEIR